MKPMAPITDMYGSAKFVQAKPTTPLPFVPKFNTLSSQMCAVSSQGESNKMLWIFLCKPIVLNRK